VKTKKKGTTNALENMKRDDEDFYFSVPRPYKDIIGQAEEINRFTTNLREGKVSLFKERQEFKD